MLSLGDSVGLLRKQTVIINIILLLFKKSTFSSLEKKSSLFFVIHHFLSISFFDGTILFFISLMKAPSKGSCHHSLVAPQTEQQS